VRDRVAIVGVGQAGYSPLTTGLSYRELIFEAALRAYDDAGVDPRKDVDSFVTVAEDFLEGTSIFDEYVPDQIGGAMRPVQTIAGDGLFALATAYMLIQSGIAQVVAVEGHSKASDILTPDHILEFALDPVLNRPLGAHPHVLAGLEMVRYCRATGTTLEQCAAVVAKNRTNALDNPLAAYPSRVSAADVLAAKQTFSPITAMDGPRSADGAIVVVLASEAAADKLTDMPVWVLGAGWAMDTPSLESRSWTDAVYAQIAAQKAYEMAGVTPRQDIDLVECDDTWGFKELQHLEALGLARPGEAGLLTEEGVTARYGDLPVNPSGGSLGMGYLHEANGLARALELTLQLRGEAGERQVEDAEVGVAMSWRGVPTASGAVVVLGAD